MSPPDRQTRRARLGPLVCGLLLVAITVGVRLPAIMQHHAIDDEVNYSVVARQLMDGLQVTASMSLRGLKDARGPMWVAGASYWLAGAPMCALLGFGFGMKGLGIWLGLAFGLLVAAVLLTTRFAILSKKPAPVR